MPTDGQRGVATWQPWGPGLQSIEDISTGTGWLGVDYTTGCDTRWPGRVTLGPLLTSLDCSGAGGTTANANGLALSNGMNATKFIYVIRGTKWAKIKASDMSLISDGTETALGEAATSILYTKTAAGTEEISFGMAATAYRVITTVGNTTTDTHSANSSSKKLRTLGKGSPADTYAGLGQDGSSNENTIYHNVLTGSTTMASPNWVTRATLTDSIQFTGFGMSGNAWVPGTNDGPYVLDNDFQRFKPLIPELDLNTNHCAQMDTWKLLNGLIIPLNNGLLLMRNEAQTSSFIGVEKYPFNTSPITGRVSALAGTPRWLYLNYYNPVTTDTYLMAARPRQAGDPFGQEVVYFPLAKMASTASNFLSNIGTYGSRTLPTLVMGKNSDVYWFSEGRLDQFPDDTSYTYAASGSLYLTEMRREPHWMKEIDYVEFETAGCTSTETITMKIGYDGNATAQVGAAVTSNGLQRFRMPKTGDAKGRRIKLQFDFARGGTTTATPQIVSTVRVGFHYRALVVDGETVEE